MPDSTEANDPADIAIPAPILARLRSATAALALTGAGISAESGIPTFRAPGTGLWSQYRITDFATPGAWQRNPKLVWGWYTHRRRIARAAQPNPGHRALATLEAYYPDFTLVTQNVDGLHTRAGSTSVAELHGNIHRFRCTAENIRVGWTDPEDDDPAAMERLERGEGPEVPTCPRCGALLRPDVVWFEEPLPDEPYQIAAMAAAHTDVCFVVGTSALVYPAASLPLLARRAGALVVEVNPEPTDLTPHADLSLHGPAGVILPALAMLIVAGENES
jgi:NAD-dependent deacetylase